VVRGSRKWARGGLGLGFVVAVSTLLTSCSSASGSSAGLVRSAGCHSGAGRAPTTTAVAPSASATAIGSTALHTVSLRVDGRTATYLVEAPPSASHRPVPLVVLFHGAGVDANYIARLTELPARGVRRGVLVAVPNSAGKSWDANPDGPDGHLVGAMLASLSLQYCVDKSRVSLVGLSAGAVFAVRYACRHSGEFAAIATVTVEYQLGCTLPLSILAYHGTADPTVPYAGAPGDAVAGLRATGTLTNMAAWAQLNDCDRTPVTTRVASQVERRTWTNCAAGAEVVLYTILGGGHTWPDADQPAHFGMTTHQLDATSEALDFFARHST